MPELVVIAGIAALVFGPKKLPEVDRSTGKTVKSFQQALKVFVPSYESCGRMWPHMHTRIIAALLLFQVTMLSYFGVKKFYYTPIPIPLPISSLIFALVCSKKFYLFFQSTALEVACHELKESPNIEHVFRSYIPAPLAVEKLGDDQFEDAMSHVSRNVSSV